MHVVLVTSMLRPINDRTIFSTSQRIEQTYNTIATIRQKIPNNYIVMIEGGDMNENEQQEFSKLVDFLFRTDVKHLPKSPGEGTLLHRYLTSDHFKSLENVETVSKLSGRYYLNDDFHWDENHIDKFLIGLIPSTSHLAWMKKSLYKTRYYRIPQKYIQYFIDGLTNYINSKEFASAWPDIEHCFYLFDIIKHDEVYSPEKIGVCGLITGSNEFISD